MLRNRSKTQKTDWETVEVQWHQRRLLAFFVCAGALFLVVTLLQASKARGYRVDTGVKFRVDEQVVDVLNQDVLSAMQQETGDTQLVSVIKELHNSKSLKSRYLIGSDLDGIRKRLKVYARNEGDLTEIRFSFLGQGTQDEVTFLKRIVHNVLGSLKQEVDFGPLDTMFSDVSQHLKTHLVNQDRFTVNLKTEIGQVDSQLERIDGLLQGFGTRHDKRRNKQTSLFVPNELQASDNLRKLLEQRESLFIGGADSRTIEGLDRQIAVAETKLYRATTHQEGLLLDEDFPFDDEPIEQIDPVAPIAPIQEVPAESASFSQPNLQYQLPKFLSEISDEITKVDTRPIGEYVDSIKKHRHDDLAIPIKHLDELSGKVSSYFGTESDPTVVEAGTTQIFPNGGVPSPVGLFWMLASSIVFGGVVALLLNPAAFDRGFSEDQQIESALGVPIVGRVSVIKPKEGEQFDLFAKLYTVCKWILLVLGIGLLLAFVLNTSVRQTMLDNPWHGLTRFIHLFKSA